MSSRTKDGTFGKAQGQPEIKRITQLIREIPYPKSQAEILQSLLAIFDAAIALEKYRNNLTKRLERARQTPINIRDMRIVQDYLNDHKLIEIAARNSISVSRVHAIIKSKAPLAQELMQRGTGGTVARPDRIEADFDAIDAEIDADP
jgi:hypothetical protein